MTDTGTPAGREALEIAIADEGDLPGIVGILNEVTASSIASFDTRPTSVAERRDWFGQFSTAGPYRLFIARRDGRTVGYACTRPYRPHEAFRETVEVGIAIDAGCRGQGVGSSLYNALFESIDDEQIHLVVAGIAVPNDASVALHRKFGFTEVGTFREYAVKNGQYISSLWMQRFL